MFKRIMVTVVGMLLGAMAPLYANEGDKRWGAPPPIQ